MADNDLPHLKPVIGLVNDIKERCGPETWASILGKLSKFPAGQISYDEMTREMKRDLKDHPDLLARFEAWLASAGYVQ